jgi:hypothetical protein
MNARNLSLAGLILAVVMGIGAFLPWVSLLGISVSGVSEGAGDGWFVLAGAVVALVGAFWGFSAGRLRVGPGLLILIGGALGAVVAFVDWPPAAVAIGLVLCAIGGVLLALLGLVGLIIKPAP